MGRKPESKSSQRRILAREREGRALELRKAGYTYAQIAAELGYKSVSAAYGAVVRAMEKLVPVEDAEALRQLEREKLDKMERVLWQQAEGGDHAAIDRILRIMERRARLTGIDAPAKQEIKGSLKVSSDWETIAPWILGEGDERKHAT